MTEIERQIETEERAVGKGIERYQYKLKKYGVAESTPGLKQTLHLIGPFVEAYKEWDQALQDGLARDYGTIANTLRELSPEVIAFITIKRCIMAVTKGEALTSLAMNVSRLLQNEINAARFKEQDKDNYNKTLRKLKKSSDYRHRAAVFTFLEGVHNINTLDWDHSTRLRIGMKLIYLLVDSSDLFEIQDRIEKKGMVKYVVPTDATKAWFSEAHRRAEILTPIYQPMVVPPKDWTNPNDGGYYTFRLTIIKSRDKNYLHELENMDLSKVYGAINTLQKTAWRINKKVYGFLSEIWDSNGTLGGVPPRDKYPMPPKPADIDENEEARKKWRKAAAEVWDKNVALTSHIHACDTIIRTAGVYQDEQAIYFPYTMDWRGRIYAVPTLLNPQGSDLAKGVLEFSEGKPLGASGAQWLMIHVANLFGIDKVSMNERIQWVHDHIDALLDSATNPLDGQRFWCKADKPFQALAACIELAGYWEEGESYVSHLPIALDGSCNGIQNFSAMLRDLEGGAAVNLVPSEIPNDIYQQVADVVSKKVSQDAQMGIEYAAPWVGNVTRKVVKRPVMTLPYGATKIGMRDQIRDVLKKEEAHLPAGTDIYHAASYLANVVYESIGEVVKAARLAMDWLQDAAKIAAQDGMPIHWITPAGLPVLQAYHVIKGVRIQTMIDGRRVQTMINQSTREISKAKMASSISPNFVHSMDASHLMLTTCAAAERGVTAFAMIHDSYATHAADTDTLAEVLRETFIFQYETNDVLEQFRTSLVNQLSEDLAAQIDVIPSKGTLDLNMVKSSVYFFA
jgi:DNA-directed RNA polymerase